MRVAVIRHHEEDSAGFIGEAFRARGAELSEQLFPGGRAVAALGGIDHVVVPGAIASVYDGGPRSWLDRRRTGLAAAGG